MDTFDYLKIKNFFSIRVFISKLTEKTKTRKRYRAHITERGLNP